MCVGRGECRRYGTPAVWKRHGPKGEGGPKGGALLALFGLRSGFPVGAGPGEEVQEKLLRKVIQPLSRAENRTGRPRPGVGGDKGQLHERNGPERKNPTHRPPHDRHPPSLPGARHPKGALLAGRRGRLIPLHGPSNRCGPAKLLGVLFLPLRFLLWLSQRASHRVLNPRLEVIPLVAVNGGKVYGIGPDFKEGGKGPSP